MEILSSLVQSIGERITNVLVSTLKREVGYLVHYEETFRNIQEELDDLENKGKRVQERVDIARNNAEDIEEDVWKWLTKVHGVKEEVNAFLEGKHEVYTSCFRLRCPDFGSRRRLGREAKKKIELITRVIGDGDFDAISHRAPIGDIGLPSIADYEHFGSRQHVFNEIFEALRDDAIKVVGMCGMPGVGKSKMVGKIGEHVMKEMLFHEVTMAVVSANEDVKKIQANLAVRLGLNLSGEETESGRADLLEKRLRNGRKHLVILDDVWNKLELRSIIGFDVKEDFKGCKILLTSRSQAVLHANECQRPFLIELLKKEEAWDLFKKTLNCVGNLDILPLMEKVCEECGCLPLVIRAVGAALKGKDKSAWEDALERFRNSAPQNISGIDRKMYALLKLSYDQLEPDEGKSCLLLCSLFGEDADISIDDLLRHAKAMGFLEHVRTLEQARNRVLSLVDTLRTSCLLLEGTEDNSVKMHDVIRGVAISIASEDKKHAFVVKDGVLEWPDIDDTYRATKVMSIRSEKFGKIPDKLDCPDLHTLVLQCSSSGALRVPNTFFSRLEKLRVLNLSGISTMSLQWVPNLANLRMLCLDDCKLEDICLLGELEKLEMLTLNCSNIEELPQELGQLTHLRLLDLKMCKRLKVIPPHVLSSLSQLEELYIPDGFNNWVVEGTKGQNRSTSLFEELSSLNCLRALETHIPSLMCFPKEKICKNLTRYDIRCRRDDRILLGLPRSSRKTVIIKGEDFVDLKGGIKFLVERAEALFLTFLQLHDLRKVFNESDRESFVDLKYLKVHSFHDMDYLLGLQKPVSTNHTQISSGSFSKLTVLDIFRCGFKYLFRTSIARGLVQLVRLKIKECEIMEEVVRIESQGEEDESKSLVVFPRLKSLKLRSLPSLTSFNSKMSKTSATLGTRSSAAQPLFDGKVAFPALEELEIFCIESAREIWDSHSFKQESFCQLRVLEVYECDKLEIVVPSAVIPRLKNLEVFSVQNCASVTVISEFQGLNVAEPFAAAMTLLPRLRKLKLKRLPNLTKMGLNSNKNCLGNLVCPNVTTLSIDGCNSLRNVFSPSMARSLVNLEKLKVRNCEVMKEIIAATEKDQEESYEEIVFPKLRCLVLSRLCNVKCFWSCGSKKQKAETFLQGELAINGTQPPFDHKVVFPGLEELRITHLVINSIDISLGHTHAVRSCKLRVLCIKNCNKVSAVVSPTLILRLLNLERFSVTRCDQLRELFDLEGLNVGEGDFGLLSKVRRLNLNKLSRLQCLWNKDPHGILSFQSLTVVIIRGCGLLRNLFSCSVAGALQQLRVLIVKSCQLMEEIIASGEDKKVTGEIVFPQLKLIKLEKLPNLTSFSRANYALIMPLLTVAALDKCPKMQIFTSGDISMPMIKIFRSKNLSFWIKDLNNYVQQQVLNGKGLAMDDRIDGTDDGEEDEEEIKLYSILELLDNEDDNDGGDSDFEIDELIDMVEDLQPKRT